MRAVTVVPPPGADAKRTVEIVSAALHDLIAVEVHIIHQELSPGAQLLQIEAN
jgi:hypothetical protein